jgi:hypothetical protein
MQFELQARSVMRLDFRQPRLQIHHGEDGEPPVAFLHAPVILAERRQHRVSQRQLHLGQIPADKIRLLAGKNTLLEQVRAPAADRNNG